MGGNLVKVLYGSTRRMMKASANSGVIKRLPVEGEVSSYWQKRQALVKIGNAKGYSGKYAYMAAGVPPWRNCR